MLDPSQIRLGKKPARHDPRTLRLGRYLTEPLPPPPRSIDWTTRMTDIGMMLNDSLGSCTVTSIGHTEQCWTAANGRQVIIPDSAILAAYRDVSGYIPGRPETDNGAVVLDVLNYWRRVGVGGHKIEAFAALDLRNREQFKQAIHLFGGVYLGIGLPESAQRQRAWAVSMGGTGGSPLPWTWGGHAVDAHAYIDIGDPDIDGVYCITWGQRVRMSWAFLDAYCDEAYVMVSTNWGDHDGAPSGRIIEQLRQDIRAIA